jgi:hypothetical protein
MDEGRSKDELGQEVESDERGKKKEGICVIFFC